jgi:hypothetical protein
MIMVFVTIQAKPPIQGVGDGVDKSGVFFFLCFNSVFPRIGSCRPGMDGLVNCHFRHVAAGRQISSAHVQVVELLYVVEEHLHR